MGAEIGAGSAEEQRAGSVVAVVSYVVGEHVLTGRRRRGGATFCTVARHAF